MSFNGTNGASGVFTGTSPSGGVARPGEQVIIKQGGAVVGTGIKQGDGSVNAGSTVYRPTGG